MPAVRAPCPRSLLSVPPERAGLRADAYLALAFPFLSRTRIKQKIQMGESLLNGKRYASSARLKEGDEIEVRWRGAPEPRPAQGLSLRILYEDESMLAVDKPAGVAVHPAGSTQTGTVVQWVRQELAEETARSLANGDEGFYPRLINRLDKYTSGIVLIAKQREALAAMQTLSMRAGIEKRYILLVEGRIDADRGTIELPIGRAESAVRLKMAACRDGLPCVTEYMVLRRMAHYTLLHAFPRTGRQHQIRVHFASIGHPVWGDLLYKDEELFLRYAAGGSPGVSLPHRHMLHADRVVFPHPFSGDMVEITAPLPDDFKEVVEKLD